MIRRKSRKQTQKTEQTVSAAAGQSAGQQTPPMRELSPEERRRRRNKEEIKSFFFRLIILILFLWLMFGVCFGIAPVKNGDMFPRINAGDLMLYYRLERDYNSQDVIVYEADREQRVGRVIAHEVTRWRSPEMANCTSTTASSWKTIFSTTRIPMREKM